jgi:Leucine-rich repeat (LRR) protein
MKLHKSLKEALKVRKEVRALKLNIKSANFPTELLNFPNLTELYLEGNCTELPEDVSEWQDLKILSIKWPAFKGDISSLFKLPSLENLKIIETPLLTFLLPLGHAAAPLKSLTIKDCGLKSLPEEISMLTRLHEINFSGNNLKTLPISFIDLLFLKRLNLDHNQFENFPDKIKKMTALTHLSIDNNLFSAEEKARIQRVFHISPH